MVLVLEFLVAAVGGTVEAEERAVIVLLGTQKLLAVGVVVKLLFLRVRVMLN